MNDPVDLQTKRSFFDFEGDRFQLIEATKGQEPKVCVLMPTYNHAEYISQAVEGVLGQKADFPIRLCISDDGSSDNTTDICFSYQSQFPDQIELIYSPENTQCKIARSLYYRGLASKSKYIAFCEGDDYWIDTLKLQKQIYLMERNTKCSGCCHDAKVIDGNGKIILQSCKERPHFYQVVNSDHLIREKGIVYSGFRSQVPTASFLFRGKVIDSLIQRFNGVTSDVHLMLTAVDLGDFFLSTRSCPSIDDIRMRGVFLLYGTG